MGTDIHLFVEQRDENGVWEPILKEIPDHIYDLEDEVYNLYKKCSWLYEERNYNLFAMLADVRNGYGFGGVDTGDGFNPIHPPKGLPNDVSKILSKLFDEYGDHTPSYLSLKELLDFDWNQTTKHRGLVGKKEFLVFKEQGKPNSWAGGVSGPNTRILNHGEMQAWIDGILHLDPEGFYYTRVVWEETYAKSSRGFLEEAIPKLEELAGDDPESIRIVFWFDS